MHCALGPQGSKVSPNAYLTYYTYHTRVGRDTAKPPVEPAGCSAHRGGPFHAASSYSSPHRHTPAATCPACDVSSTSISCGWGERLAQRCGPRLAAVSSRCASSEPPTSFLCPFCARRSKRSSLLQRILSYVSRNAHSGRWVARQPCSAATFISSHSFFCASAALLYPMTTTDPCCIVSFSRRLPRHGWALRCRVARAGPRSPTVPPPHTQRLPRPLGSEQYPLAAERANKGGAM